MYMNKLVVSLKHGGKVLRESKDGSIQLPFGSEYTIYIKNLHTQRAVCTVFIDGEDALGRRVVVDPGSFVELERFDIGSATGGRFKFIERTQAVEDAKGGIQPEDGLVRVEWEYEILRPIFQPMFPGMPPTPVYPTHIWDGGYTPAPRTPTAPGIEPFSPHRVLRCTYGGLTGTPAVGTSNVQFTNGIAYGDAASSNSTTTSNTNDAGVTVKGSQSEQQFKTIAPVATDGNRHSLVLRLVGVSRDGEVVHKAITTKDKLVCDKCGAKHIPSAKFCSNCGNSLSAGEVHVTTREAIDQLLLWYERRGFIPGISIAMPKHLTEHNGLVFFDLKYTETSTGVTWTEGQLRDYLFEVSELPKAVVGAIKRAYTAIQTHMKG